MNVKPKSLELSDLPIHVRDEVVAWQRLLKNIANTRPSRKSVELIATSRKVAVSTVYRKLRQYERHGWRGLVNRAKFPVNPSALPQTFQIFLRGLWLLNQRNYRHTHNQIVAMWRGGAEIPGCDQSPQAAFKAGYPVGWSYENIIYLIQQLEKKYPNIDRYIVRSFVCSRPIDASRPS